MCLMSTHIGIFYDLCGAWGSGPTVRVPLGQRPMAEQKKTKRRLVPKIMYIRLLAISTMCATAMDIHFYPGLIALAYRGE